MFFPQDATPAPASSKRSTPMAPRLLAGPRGSARLAQQARPGAIPENKPSIAWYTWHHLTYLDHLQKLKVDWDHHLKWNEYINTWSCQSTSFQNGLGVSFCFLESSKALTLARLFFWKDLHIFVRLQNGLPMNWASIILSQYSYWHQRWPCGTTFLLQDLRDGERNILYPPCGRTDGVPVFPENLKMLWPGAGWEARHG